MDLSYPRRRHRNPHMDELTMGPGTLYVLTSTVFMLGIHQYPPQCVSCFQQDFYPRADWLAASGPTIPKIGRSGVFRGLPWTSTFIKIPCESHGGLLPTRPRPRSYHVGSTNIVDPRLSSFPSVFCCISRPSRHQNPFFHRPPSVLEKVSSLVFAIIYILTELKTLFSTRRAQTDGIPCPKPCAL